MTSTHGWWMWRMPPVMGLKTALRHAAWLIPFILLSPGCTHQPLWPAPRKLIQVEVQRTYPGPKRPANEIAVIRIDRLTIGEVYESDFPEVVCDGDRGWWVFFLVRWIKQEQRGTSFPPAKPPVDDGLCLARIGGR